MIRFSLTTLFLLVALAALGCAALLYASPLIKQVTVTSAALLLALASLVALLGRGRRRALAGGFAFFGWIYLVLAYSSALGVQQHLLTRDASGWLYDKMHKQATNTATRAVTWQPSVVVHKQPAPQPTPVVGSTPPGAAPVEWWGVYQNRQPAAAARPRVGRDVFYAIGDALWVLLLGLLGAVVAGVVYARGRREPATAGAAPSCKEN